MFAHGLLGWPLGSSDQVDRNGPAAPGNGVRAVMGFIGEFGIFVYDDDESGILISRFPYPFTMRGFQRGALVKQDHRIPEQLVSLLGCCGESAEA